MTFPEFDKFQASLLEQVVKMKDTKGKEYTNGQDRFENFNQEAIEMDVDRLKVAEIFLNKHMRSIKSYIRTGGQVFSTESIQGRIVDAITYLTLIGGMIEENESKRRSKTLENVGYTIFDRVNDHQIAEEELHDPLSNL